MQRITKKELARRLERQTGINDGMAGLNTLLYGWVHFRKYGNKYKEALRHRDWMYISEVKDFAEYAQCDLTETEF
ncbi:MAG: hypothetical protein II970_02880 [Paludibacteraceae bacterium]|nr:hypothetical protein [Paludibacteraceae bacterium]